MLKQIRDSRDSTSFALSILLFGCAFTALTAMYVSYLLGSNYFFLSTDLVIDSEALATVVTAFLFIGNVFLFTLVLTNIPIIKALIGTMAYIPLYILTNSYMPEEYQLISTSLIPYAYILLLFLVTTHRIYKRDLIMFVTMFVVSTVLVLPYQFITGIIKLNIETDFAHNYRIGALSKVFYSVDYFLFLGLLSFLKGGVLNGRYLELLVFPQSVKSGEPDKEDREAFDRVANLDPKQRAVFVVALYAFQIFQLLLVLGICMVGNVLIEGALIVLAFLATGSIIKRKWHSNSVLICSIVAGALFFIASKISVPARISILFPIIIGVLICYSLYRIAIYSESNKK